MISAILSTMATSMRNQHKSTKLTKKDLSLVPIHCLDVSNSGRNLMILIRRIILSRPISFRNHQQINLVRPKLKVHHNNIVKTYQIKQDVRNIIL